MCPKKAVQTAILVVALLTQPATANPTLLCPATFSGVESTTKDDWTPPTNIFTKSVPYAAGAAIAMLTLTQYLKHLLLGDPDAPVFSEAFHITILNDTLTTLTSHYIATSRLEPLKRFMSGERRNGQVGFWRRAGANWALGTTLISLTWLGTGMDVGVKEVCGAAALCAVVYPTLQATKRALYERLPLRRDMNELDRLAEKFPEEVDALRQVAKDRAQELGVTPKDAEFLILTALEAVVTNQPLERQLSGDLTLEAPQLHSIRDDLLIIANDLSKFGADLSTLNRASLNKVKKLVSKQRTLRRQLLNILVEVYDRTDETDPAHHDALELLSVGEGLDPAFTIALQKSLRDRLKGQRGRLAIASVVDMTIAIGFFWWGLSGGDQSLGQNRGSAVRAATHRRLN